MISFVTYIFFIHHSAAYAQSCPWMKKLYVIGLAQ